MKYIPLVFVIRALHKCIHTDTLPQQLFKRTFHLIPFVFFQCYIVFALRKAGIGAVLVKEKKKKVNLKPKHMELSRRVVMN